MSENKSDKIRNIAIIAHVDHGKTTLVDAFLKQSHIFHENQEEMTQEQILDTGDLEREKGITIKAKNASIHFGDYKINIIDTPGHADFGGEVERTLNMADGAILVVDAQEGPMPQTKFVLKIALKLGLKLIVVINKIDKKYADVEATEKKIDDLILDLATNPEQLDYKILYAIAREGKVFAKNPEDFTIDGNTIPLLQAIIDEIPAPVGDVDAPFQMQISSLDYDAHRGRYLIGRVKRGTVKVKDKIVVLDDDDKEYGEIKNIFVIEGVKYKEVQEAGAGEIVALSGIDSTAIGATICDSKKQEPLPMISITSPTVAIKFEANTSPFVGQEGKFVTVKLLQQRLDKEAEQNISLDISQDESGGYIVAGRGELQLSILIETLRREGYEFQVKKPEVILKDIDTVTMEPLEELLIETPEEYLGTISTMLQECNAEVVDISTNNGHARFVYQITTRNLLGLRTKLINATKGNFTLHSFVLEYIPLRDYKEPFRNGVLIASETGTALGYALNSTQERGDLFISPGVEVYTGMIVGINKYPENMDVNVTKARHKSAVRMNHSEITLTNLKPTIPLTLDFALTFLSEDEILEVTPKNLRLRKKYLDKNQRIKAERERSSK